MASPKYQVFISSTFEDLQEERDQVIKAVLEMGHIPVGMEMFSAADEEQWQIITRHIEESDYYAVVVGRRYGSKTPEGISFTRKEYEHALGLDIPCLGFIIDDKALWPGDRTDTGRDKALLEDFKILIRQKPVHFWSSAEDLHGKFSISLMKAFASRPRQGWVRASTAAGPEVTGEVVRLSAENAALRKQLSEARDEVRSSKQAELRALSDKLFSIKTDLSYRYERHNANWETATTSLRRCFLILAPELTLEATVETVSEVLAMEIREDASKSWDIVAMNQVRALLADLMTFELVQPSTRRHAVSDKHDYWSLTSSGLELFKYLRKRQMAKRVAEKPGADAEEASADNSAATSDGTNLRDEVEHTATTGLNQR